MASISIDNREVAGLVVKEGIWNGRSEVKPYLLLALIFLLVGCATPHLVTLKDGTVIHARKKPAYDARSSFYLIESEDGRKLGISKDLVDGIRKDE